MGILQPRPQPNDPFSQLSLNPSQPEPQAQENSPARIWSRSNKTVDDLLAYLHSDQSPGKKYEDIEIFISSVTNRERLYACLRAIQTEICGGGVRGDGREELLETVHGKLENLFFVWGVLGSSHLTAVAVHERMLPQIANYSYSQKLQMLYQQCSSQPSLQLTNTSLSPSRQPQPYPIPTPQTLIQQAIRTNFPFLITQATLQQLFKGIIDRDVVIEDVGYFGRFVGCVLDVLGDGDRLGECREYVERLVAFGVGQDQQKYVAIKSLLQKQNNPDTIVHQLLQSGRIFLTLGYPHAMQLLFQSLTKHKPQYPLHQPYTRLHLYTKIYSLFLYELEEINLEFGHLEKMTIGNVMHLMLRGNQRGVLLRLRDVYGEVKGGGKGEGQGGFRQEQVSGQQQFQSQLINYIFSSYCNLQMCLQITTATPLAPITPAHPQRQQQLLTKLNQSKFQLIIQNQAMVMKAIEGCLAGNKDFLPLIEKMEEILELVRLFYMFGVNQRFGVASGFYCPRGDGRGGQLTLIEQQERALSLFKAFISKFYITASTKNKKITLNPRSNTPLHIDLAKPESIFQISQYLYQKLFSSALKSLQQLHQIIFQHMIYFYRYEQAKTLLTSPSLLSKHSIKIQTLQLIIINNIIEELQKSYSDPKKIINDVNQQLRLIRKGKGNVEVQSVRAMVRLVTMLDQVGVELTGEEKRKMDMAVLDGIVERYGDRIDVIDFDAVYEEIRAINANQIIDEQEKFMMTNDLLQFKSRLAGKAYQLGKKNLGNELIDQISRFNPPWLTTQLIKIFKQSNTKIDKRIYGTAMKSCSKGSDLQYLMQLWKQQQGKERRKEKGFADITDYFQTGRQYLVIDDTFIKSEERYRNYVAECQFNDEMLHGKKYEMFFVLLGAETERAFHYGVRVGLDPGRVQVFLKGAMKTGIIDCFACLEHLHKYFYFAWKLQNQKMPMSQIPIYFQYCKFTPTPAQLQTHLQTLKQSQNKSPLSQFYQRTLTAYKCSKSITQNFLNTYFNNSSSSPSPSPSSSSPEQNRTNLAYNILFNETIRKNLLIGLREEPMGRSDIFLLDSVCREVLQVNLLELCVFSLAGLVNVSRGLGEKCENILQKIVTLTTGKREECRQIVGKLIDKIFAMANLVEVLKYLQSRQNPIYPQILPDRNLQILESLSLIQLGQQLHGLIPPSFFNQQIGYNPQWPISNAHQKLLKACWTKNNIFVLSKVMYFVYGMNGDVEDWVWESYLKENPDQELREIKNRLDLMKKQQR